MVDTVMFFGDKKGREIIIYMQICLYFHFKNHQKEQQESNNKGYL